MTKKIFKSTILVAATVLIFGTACVMAILYQYFGKQITNELEKEAAYLAYGVEQDGTEYLEQIKEKTSRITYIAQDGTVLFDNQADADTMENHVSREEVQEALKSGSGHAERMSETLSTKTIYYALRLSDQSVLRISSTHYSVFVLIMELIPPVLGIVILMIIFAGFVSAHMASKIVEPINNIDLEHPEDNRIYEEIGPLLSKIYKQNRQIRSQLEEARRNQEEFRIITENMQEGLLVIDSYTKVLSGNASIWRMFQMRESAIGDSVYSLNRNEDFRRGVEQVLSGKHSSTLLRLNDEAIQLIANPVTRGGKTVGAVLLLMNETEKVEREKLRREFSANVSHELKTPLTSISGFAEIMKSGMVKDGDIEKFSDKIYQEAQRLIHLVEDIIRLSQLDEGENPYEWEKSDIHFSAEAVCERLKGIAEKKNIQLCVEGDHAAIYTVQSILEEVLFNLCENGIKYNRENGNVTVSLKDRGEDVEITVKDTGIGIPAGDRNRVFERFYRVDKSHSSEIGGTGLGLSIVKHGVAFLGGSLKMVSELNKGTEIRIVLPKERSDN